jgi:hypothetical protein
MENGKWKMEKYEVQNNNGVAGWVLHETALKLLLLLVNKGLIILRIVFLV